MERLGNYELTGKLTDLDSGYSVCSFGKRNGQDYFIKEFLSPKFPYKDTVSSPQRIQKKIARCKEFEKKKANLYRVLDDCSDGNAVRIREFFRIGAKYYVAMPRIQSLPWDTSTICNMDLISKRRICCIIAHSVASIHRGGLIHADLKPTNILFTKTTDGVTAKLIDFDSGFLESDPLTLDDEIIGDQIYFSPEACLHAWGENVPLTCKMDVFALGVLFHQYFCGAVPGFDQSVASYSGEAAAKGCKLTVSSVLPEDVAQMVTRMLEADPAKRPTSHEVWAFFRGAPEPAEEPKPVVKPIGNDPINATTTSGNPFFRPGDL